MKRLKRLGVFAAACAVAATPFALMGHASAEAPVNTANTTYNDYKKLPTIMDTQYENAKLFYTADTNIIVKDAGGDGGVPGNYNISERYAIREPGQEVIFLLTGTTARDAFGDPADVIIRAHNLRKWDNPRDGEDQFGRIVLQSNICGIANSEASQAAPSETDCENNSIRVRDVANAPIVVGTTVGYSDFDLSVEYIKAGSYNDTTKKGTPAGVNAVSFVAYDLDVLGGNYPDESPISGHEGFYRLNPQEKTDFYYFLDHSEDPESQYHMYTGADGIGVDKTPGYEFNGLHYGTSVIGTSNNIKDSKYTIRYSASGAGIQLYFGTPNAYDLRAPTKTIADAGKTKCVANDQSSCAERDVAEGDKFNYVISQKVPANYSDSFDTTFYRSLYMQYPNIRVDRNYSKFQIRDTLDAHTTVSDVKDIKIYDENEKDVTSLFDIILENNFFMASAKRDTLSSVDFYGHTYRAVIPVSVNADKEEIIVENTTSTVYKFNFEDDAAGDRIASSNTTAAKVAKKNVEKVVVTTKYTDKKGKKIAETVTKEYAKGSKYSTAAAKKVPKGYQLSKVPKNSTGIANADVTVTYVYELINSPDTIDNGPLTAILIFTGFGAAAAFFTFRLARRR